MAWSDYIASLKKEFLGVHVVYQGYRYTIVDVDMNGVIHIDKPSKHNKTTAVYYPEEARRAIVE